MIGSSFIFNPRHFPESGPATAASKPGLRQVTDVHIVGGDMHRLTVKPGNVATFLRSMFGRAKRSNEPAADRPTLPDGDCWPIAVLNGELIHTGWITPPRLTTSPGEMGSLTGGQS